MNFFKIAKKSLGQNFLIDQNIINKIIKIGKIAENKTVLEIGPGYGNLTRKIANMKPKKILAIEKDKKLALFLKNIFKDFKNIKIINNDIFNIIENKNLDQNTIVFGNLPYNISTQILASLVLLEKSTLVTVSKFLGFLILNILFFFGINDRTVELILGLGEKQFFETSKCFFISNLQLHKIDNLPKSLIFFFARILSATSFWNMKIKISYQGGHFSSNIREANI